MIPLVFILACHVVAVKIFKKTAPNGKVTLYLGNRDFVDRLDGNVDPIDGLLVVDSDYLRNRKIYGMLNTTWRWGRSADEVMGLHFSKEMILTKEQIVPPQNKSSQLTQLQEKLIKKLGDNNNVFPFTFRIPQTAPPSVTLQQTGDEDDGKPLGVEYEIKAFVADNDQDPGHKRSSVSLRIRKVQFADLTRVEKQPSTLVSKGFALSSGKLNLEVTLNRDIYYHGEEIGASVHISNSSKKSVKNIKIQVIQHTELTMINVHSTRTVAHLETREGCPITPGSSLTKVFYLNPSASNNKDKRGIALDGNLKDSDVNLASSTMLRGNSSEGGLGFVVSYSVRVKLNLGTLGGEMEADLPFKLLHPGPDGLEQTKGSNKLNPKDRSKYEKACYAKDADEDENIIFEDFAKLRISMSEIDK